MKRERKDMRREEGLKGRRKERREEGVIMRGKWQVLREKSVASDRGRSR